MVAGHLRIGAVGWPGLVRLREALENVFTLKTGTSLRFNPATYTDNLIALSATARSIDKSSYEREDLGLAGSADSATRRGE